MNLRSNWHKANKMKHQSSRRDICAFLLITSAILACNQFTPDPTATVTAPPPTNEPEVSVTVQPTESSEPIDPQAGSSGLGDSLFPAFGNGGYDVEHYTLDITVNDVSTSNLTAITTIEARATQPLNSFNLDFLGFEISSITVNEESATFERSGQELTITPVTQLAENESFVVTINYQGSPEQLISKAIPFQTGWVTFDGGSYVLSEAFRDVGVL